MHALTDRDDPDSCAVVRDVPGGPCDQTRKAKFKYPAWTAGLDYKINDALFVYAKTSGASMSGGWNIRDTFAPAFKPERSEEHTSELQSLMRISYAVFCLKKKKKIRQQ